MVLLRSCRFPTPHEAISRGGDYSTLKRDLAESCLQRYYVTLSTRTATWPQGSPVFSLTICPSPFKALLHSATHTVNGHLTLEVTSSCFHRCIYISHSSGCEEELYKWDEEDVGARRQETTPRCANGWLILNRLRIAMLIYCTYFLFSSWLDRCISESYSPCVGEEK